MEFPDLGKNCSHSSCNELDFLPFTCSFCNLIFCKDHVNRDRHECRAAVGGKLDSASTETFSCSFDDCRDRSPVEMLCPKCKNHFCLLHRYHSCFDKSQEELDAQKQVWNASKQQFTESLNQVNKIINEGIQKSLQKPKKQEMAQKINLLRLKGKSKGPQSIPTESRLYFAIIFNKGSKGHVCQPIFTSGDWSVGRVIDSVSDVCGVSNNNNVLNAKKLRLFKKCDGFQISSDMSIKINDLISENRIMNGETLILEYVSPDEDLSNYRLSNFEEYKE